MTSPETSVAATPDSRAGRWLLPVFYIVVIGGMAALRYATPLGQWMTLEALAGLGRDIQALPLAPLIVLASYIVMTFMGLPMALLIMVAAAVFGPWWGMAYAWGGMLVGALASYGVGRTSSAWVDRVAGARMQAIASAGRRHGLGTVIFLRVAPVAPFLLVNLACGALRLTLKDFLLGSALGFVPLVIVWCLFVDRLTAVLKAPSVATLGLLAVSVVAAVLLFGYIKRRSRRASHEVAARG